MNNYLYHHGILGQKWGVRRWQNEDGSLTEEGRLHYGHNKREDAKVLKRAFNADRSSVYSVLNNKGKDIKLGENQRRVLEEYKKEANNSKHEKRLNELDKEILQVKKDYLKLRDKALSNNLSKKEEETVLGLANKLRTLQYEYQFQQKLNSADGQKIANKYISKMNSALAKDIGLSEVSAGIQYATEHKMAWDNIYIYNTAFFNKKF